MWHNKYVGIPFEAGGKIFDGADCYGLVKLVYACEHAVTLNDFTDYYADGKLDAEQIHKLILLEDSNWIKVAYEDRAEADVMVMSINGNPMHLGIVINDTNMLHVLEGKQAVIESYRSALWKHRITGVYRHMSMAKQE